MPATTAHNAITTASAAMISGERAKCRAEAAGMMRNEVMSKIPTT